MTSPGIIPDNSNWDMMDPREAQRRRATQFNNPTPQQRGQMHRQRMPHQEGGDPEHDNGEYVAINGLHGPRFTAQSNMSDMLRQHNQRAADRHDSPNPQAFDNEQGQPLMGVAPGHNESMSGDRLQMIPIERKDNGGVRMCQRCLKCKPDRSHHCSQCNQCILKMDHHCPWVANCIGFYNYKYFMCMLFYTSVTCNVISMTSHRVVQAVLQREGMPYGMQFYVVTAYVLACVFGIIITCFLLFHIWLISNQYTTIEYCEKRRSRNGIFSERSPYDLGCYQNFKTILGSNIFLWFFPIEREHSGNGLYFAIN